MTAPLTAGALAVEVAERIGYPVSDDAVAAAIETLGVRDVDVRERFLEPDVFALARRIRPAVEAAAPIVAPAPRRGMASLVFGSASRFAAYYSRGLFYALPMIIQVATVAFLRLDVIVRLSDAQATEIMLGSILSFVATGGFVQSIGRLGSVYVGRGSYRLARELAYRIVIVGMAAAAGAGVLLFVLGAALHVLPAGRLGVAVVYDLVLSILWLTLALLYMLQRRMLVLVSVVVWVGTLALFLEVVHLGIYASEWLSAGIAALVAADAGGTVLHRLVRSLPAEQGVETMPPLRALVGEVRPYFWYGVLYFAFVFLDRVVAWTKAPPPHYRIFFHRGYELGVDWALVTLLLSIALIDYTITAFSQRLVPTQKQFDSGRIRSHNLSFQRFYARQLGLLTGVAAVSSVGVYAIGIALRDHSHNITVEDFFGETTTYHVFLWAALGYGLLVWGLLNVTFFFYLSRPGFAVRPLLFAVLTGLVVALAVSRTGVYWQSIVGLAAGAFVFAAATTRNAIRLFGDFDFFAYSAY